MRTPGKSIPIALGVSMVFAITVYMLFSASLTLAVPYDELDVAATAPSALAVHGLGWAKYVVAVGAVCGTLSAVYGSMFMSSRTAFSMAQDGLLFEFLSKTTPTKRTPRRSVLFCGFISVLGALTLPSETMIKMVNIGEFPVEDNMVKIGKFPVGYSIHGQHRRAPSGKPRKTGEFPVEDSMVNISKFPVEDSIINIVEFPAED
ncbi:unnamed protein product, partial [Cyprideis torosa]